MNQYMAFLQRICFTWCERTFGKTIAYSKPERAIRIAEEAIELCQVSDVNEHQLKHLVEVVYSRKPGNRVQEIGGIMVTLLVYCEQNHINLVSATHVEIERILNKDPVAFRIRQSEKFRAGVDASGSPFLDYKE